MTDINYVNDLLRTAEDCASRARALVVEAMILLKANNELEGDE